MAAMARAVCAAASSVARSTSAASASASTSSQSKGWLVYVVETKGGKLYTGITVSLRRRMEQHAGTRAGGAKAFRADPPARLRYAETAVNRAEATRREMAIKKLRRADKLALIQDAMMLTYDRDDDHLDFTGEGEKAWGTPLAPEELAANDPFTHEDRPTHKCAFLKETIDPD